MKLKKLWRQLVRMFHPDQYENDPEKRKTVWKKLKTEMLKR